MNASFYFKPEEDFWPILGTDDVRKIDSLKPVAVLSSCRGLKEQVKFLVFLVIVVFQ